MICKKYSNSQLNPKVGEVKTILHGAEASVSYSVGNSTIKLTAVDSINGKHIYSLKANLKPDKYGFSELSSVSEKFWDNQWDSKALGAFGRAHSSLQELLNLQVLYVSPKGEVLSQKGI